MMWTISHRILTATLVGSALSATVGCGSASFNTVSSGSIAPAAGHGLRGKVHGGQQPIVGASIQLYAIGTSGQMSAATPLLNTAVTTDAQGGFSVTGDYACPYYGSLVYIVATGGNPGLGPGQSNPASGLMAAIGACTTISQNGSGGTIVTADPNLFINMDEITTVGSVYALAPFMSDYQHVGYGGYSYGIVNAFATATMLTDISTGLAPGPGLPTSVSYDPATGFPIVINTIADAIAACVNSTGIGGACQTLFGLTTVSGVVPKDTLAATLALAQHPGISPTGILSLSPPAAPYEPTLAGPPHDWTIALNYTGLNLVAPAGLAADPAGDVWVADAGSINVTEVYSGANSQQAGSSVQYSGGGILGAQALALDSNNNVWVANTAGNSVVEMDSYGNILSGAGYTAGGINAPVAIAIDSSGDAWVANYNGNSITELMPDGTASSVSPIRTTGNGAAVSQPTGIAVDGYGLIWVSNSGLQDAQGLTSQIAVFQGDGSPRYFSSQSVQNPLGLAVDSSSNVWIASNGTSQLGGVSFKGPSVSGEAVSGGGLNQPAGVAIDGNQHIWISNDAIGGSVSEFSGSGTALSPVTGFGVLQSPVGIAIDASGDVWTANSGSGSLTEFVGLAAPTTGPVITKIFLGAAKHPSASGR